MITPHLRIRPEKLIPLDISVNTGIGLILPLFPVMCIAFIVVSKLPRVYCNALLPITTYMLYRIAFWYAWIGPEYIAANYLKTFAACIIFAKSLDLTFHSDDYAKLETSKYSADSHVSSQKKISSSKKEKASLWCNLVEAWELVVSMRGIGYKFGESSKYPSQPRLPTRCAIFCNLFWKLTVNLVILDLVLFFWTFTEPHRDPWGGSIFIQSLPWPQRYSVSTIHHLSLGCMLLVAVDAIHHAYALIGIFMFSQPYESWPPLFDNPAASDSLHDFWGRRWHAVITRSVLVVGGWPGQKIARFLGIWDEIGLIFGSFIASGLFHELPLYALGFDFDWRLVAFFGVQGIGLALERLWKKMTGTPIRGWYGVLWVSLFIVVLGQPLFTDSYVMRGVTRARLIPRMLSPSGQILLPFLNRFLLTG